MSNLSKNSPELKCVKAKDYCLSVRDGTHDSPKPVDIGFPLVTSKHLKSGQIEINACYQVSEADYYEIVKRSKVNQWDVLISMIGTIGEVALVKNEPHFAIKNVGLFKSRNEADGKWLYYYLRTDLAQNYLREISRGTTQQYVPLGSLREMPIYVFDDKSEMSRIAHILGTLDDKIENNRKTAKTLEAMAQAIFQSWFVDFDPVRAKMAGESKESICKRLKLTPEILDLFPDRLVDSELGEIPDGWGVGTFGDFAEIVGGSTPSTNNSEYWFSGVHSWATPKDLSGLTLPILLATENKITDAGLQQVSSRLLPIGTVLLSSRAPIGYLAITQIPVAINQGFIAMKPHNHEDGMFLMLLVKHTMEEIISRANGSTFLEISKAKFRPIPVVSPSQDILQFFSKITIPLFSTIVYLEKMTQSLTAQRNTLLPKLISGEIRVPDVQAGVDTTASTSNSFHY